ncbi:MAG: malectin domain-containing carbohydrate-binding protein [Rhodothermales bacterium]
MINLLSTRSDLFLRIRYTFVLLIAALAMATTASAQVVVYRVNTGGAITPATDISYPDWAEDQQEALDPPPIQFAKKGTNSPYVNADVAGDQTAGRNKAAEIVFQDPVHAGVGTTLFNTQRWDPVTPEQNLIWSFPVLQERNYQVVLYFTELFGAGTGTRVFDILVEGELVVDNLDILAETGNLEKVVLAKTIDSYDHDGDNLLTIEFAAEIGIPVISAIEIVDMDSGNDAPIVVNPGNQSDDPGSNVELAVSASDPNEDVLSYFAEGLPTGLFMDSATGVISGTIDPSADGEYNVRLLVIDDGTPSRGTFAPFVWTIGSFAPIVTDPIGDLQVLDTDPDVQIDISSVFTDPAALDMEFNIFDNTNTDVVDATIENGLTLVLGFTPGARGVAEITVRATNTDGKSADDTFIVQVDGGTPRARVAITPTNGLGASTFNAGTLVVENLSTGTLKIEQVTIDLATSILPDMVFDPNGEAGDSGSKCIEANSGAEATGYIAPSDPCVDPFALPFQGGFYEASLAFDDFDAEEIFTFSVDVDPTSLKGASTVGEAGSVSGIELMGAVVTVQFTGGVTIVNDLFRVVEGGLGGGEAILYETPADAVTLAISGTEETQASFTDPEQVVVVSGPPFASVRLVQLDATLNPEDAPEGGFDIQPYEANQAMTVIEYDVALDESGTASVPVELKMTVPGNGLVGGLNYFMATTNTEGFMGRTSNTLVMELQVEGSVAFSEGWNLLGLSLEVADNNYLSLFGSLSPIGEPFLWDGAYTNSTTFDVGRGYWINVPAAGNVNVAGSEITSIVLPIVEGWNLISGPTCLLNTDDIVDSGGILVPGTFFAYEGGYQSVSQLAPNRGYWVLTTDAGAVTLTCSGVGVVAKRGAAATPAPDGFGALTVRDDAGRKQTLFFGGSLDEATDRRQYAMPPGAAQLRFDARFADDSRLAESDAAVVRIHSETYPVTVQIDALPAFSGRYVIEELVRGQVVATHEAVEGEGLVIANPDVETLRLSAESAAAEALPESFGLQGNYPNPFNPTTTVVFDLPEAANVRLDVFDLLGRRVLGLESRSMEAGAARQLSVDASELASGTYIYRLQATFDAGAQVQTGRMTLLK